MLYLDHDIYFEWPIILIMAKNEKFSKLKPAVIYIIISI